MDHEKQHKVGEVAGDDLTEDELKAIQVLTLMRKDKDPHKWHENLFGKSSIEGSSSSSKSTMEEDAETLVCLVTAHQEEKGESLIEESSLVASNIVSQEYLSHLPPLESVRDYILECGKPLKKELETSDVKADQNRIFLPRKFVEEHFIPLLRDDENVAEGISVCVYDMHGNNYNMVFRKWAKKFYVLNREWKSFIKTHGLEKKDLVTLWMFRHSISNKLCFVVEYEKIYKK